MNDKNNYSRCNSVHYLNLQLYVEMGLVVRNVHRILQFSQSTWLKPYIEKNTEMRQQSTNKFHEKFFKLMNNSCYGKTLESKRNRVNVQLVRNIREARSAVDKSLMKTFKVFDEKSRGRNFGEAKNLLEQANTRGSLCAGACQIPHV